MQMMTFMSCSLSRNLWRVIIMHRGRGPLRIIVLIAQQSIVPESTLLNPSPDLARLTGRIFRIA